MDGVRGWTAFAARASHSCTAIRSQRRRVPCSTTRAKQRGAWYLVYSSPFGPGQGKGYDLNSYRKRILFLDVLRGVAILLVLFRHAPLRPEHLHAAARPIFETLQRGGWMGVDLFFVLSGVLVSGLLFGEFHSRGTVSPGRFLVRRGFKIYPAFYLFLASTLAYGLGLGAKQLPIQVFSEVFFLQSYLPGVWPHTWSLAVEEHFYFGIAAVLGFGAWRNRERPFGMVPWLFAGVAVVALALRIHGAETGVRAQVASAFPWRSYLTPSHLRIDSLMFGVLLAYAYHQHRDRLLARVARHRLAILAVSLACLTIPFALPLETSPFVYSWGFSLIYVGSGGILLLALQRDATAAGPAPLWLRALAWVGFYSYSIYLWHLAWRSWVVAPLIRTLGAGQVIELVLYGVGAVGVGALMAVLVEMPLLRVRDRYFPSRGQTVETP